MTIRVTIVSCILMALVFLAFSNTISYQFLNWDDDIYVTNNAMVKSGEDPTWWFLHSYYYSYIPVTMLSHQLDYALFGGTPRGHHLVNVLLHSLNTLWLFLLGVVLVRERGLTGGAAVTGMAAAALLFALHPLRVESVAWVSDRKDLLSAFFALPSILFYLRYRIEGQTQGKATLVAAFVLYLLAILSKSTAIGLPFVMLVLDWYLLSSERLKETGLKLLAEKWPFFLSAAVLSIILLLIPAGGKQAYAVEQLSGSDRLLFPFYSIMFYLQKTLLPEGLSPIYPSVPSGVIVMGAIAFVICTVAAAAIALGGRKGVLVCWVTYGILILPTVVGLSSGMQAHADRFAYLSTTPFYLLTGGGIALMIARGPGLGRILGGAAVAVALIALATMTLRQAPFWASSEALWSYVYRTFPHERDYVDAYVNLGSDLTYQMKLPEAEEVLRTAVRVDSTNADAFYNLGHVLYLRGEWETAAGHFRKTTELDSTYASAFYNLAIVYSQLGRDDEAIPAMQKAARLGLESARTALRERGIPENGETVTSIFD